MMKQDITVTAGKRGERMSKDKIKKIRDKYPHTAYQAATGQRSLVTVITKKKKKR
jgi:hypothetical protein